MKPNDINETVKLFSAADVEIYLKHGWTLLDVKTNDRSCPVVYLMGKVKKTEISGEKENER